ncbi:MAG: carboxypeptidase-like regulatory domain-containing protein [Verrucomicrobia bacterium]|nr:carboxypeptidase-like regulatory domain-containing protein [Verrucomicrobiota bacterium]
MVGLAMALAFAASAQSGGAGSEVTGVARDKTGAPVAGVEISVWPEWGASSKRAKTDADGRFTLKFNPNQFGPVRASQPILIARDMTGNLAAALELEEGATNVSVSLESAVTLAGRITDLNGKPITNGQTRVLFHNERVASNLGPQVRADEEGRFEIKGLPPDRQYSIIAAARGFSQDQRIVEASATVRNRVELEPFQLVAADQRIAGVVLDENDKPVARASIYSQGDGQPNLNAQTDARGQFSMAKVCAGPIQLSANSRGGGYGTVTAAGGDTNIVIRIGASAVVQRAAPQTASLKGKPLPNLAPLGLAPSVAPADQPVLVVLFDAEQRPSRRALRLLGEQAGALKENGVAVLVVHTGSMADDAFNAWKQEAAVPFPIGCLKSDDEKSRASWGAGALPWLILTDKAHRVTAEGFDLDELDTKVKAVAK